MTEDRAAVRLLVCGSREWTDRAMLEETLDAVANVLRIGVVIEGEQRGADLMARAWAEARGIPVDPYPAEWDRYRGCGITNPAGRIRNEKMLHEGGPSLLGRGEGPTTGPGRHVQGVGADGGDVWPRHRGLGIARDRLGASLR